VVRAGEDNIMSEEAIMKQMNRAIERAMRVLNEEWPLNEQVFTKEIWLTKKGQKKFMSFLVKS